MRETLIICASLLVLAVCLSGDGTATAAGMDAAGAAGAETAAAVGDIDTSMPGDPAAGEVVYSRVCFACHGTDGRGNGGIGGDFVGDPERLQQDNAVMIATITYGSDNEGRIMPAQGSVLSEQEIKDVLSYIRREFGQ